MKKDFLEKIKEILIYIFILCDLALLVAAMSWINSGFRLVFYSDAYYSSCCNGIQLFYSNGEGFNEKDSVTSYQMTKFKDGYVLNLSSIEMNKCEYIRLDYILDGGRRITTTGAALTFYNIPIKKILFDESIWNECSFYDMEYLGNNTFMTLGIDPWITFDSQIVHEIRDIYSVFYYGLAIVCIVFLICLFVLEWVYRKQIMAIGMNIFNVMQNTYIPVMKDSLQRLLYPILSKVQKYIYRPTVVKVYNIFYPIVIAVIGLWWQKQGIDMRTAKGWMWNIIKILLIISFYVFIKVNMRQKNKDS